MRRRAPLLSNIVGLGHKNPRWSLSLPRVEYSLTELGRSLQPILDAMKAWGEAYRAAKLAE